MRISDWSSDVCSSDLQARQTAYETRHKIASGGDPAMEKRKQKIRAEFLSAQTFEAVAREYIDQMMVKRGRADANIVKRTEERRAGTESVSTCRTEWEPSS